MQNELTAERVSRSIDHLESMSHCGYGPMRDTCATALAALRAEQERNKGCDFCHREKPIKAHTYLPDCGSQYGVSVQADFCPKCGRRLPEGSAE